MTSMSKRKVQPKKKQLGREATTMKVVAKPVPGRFYAIDTPWYDEQGMSCINLYSGKRQPPTSDDEDGWSRQPIVLEEIFPGSIIYYVREEEVKELVGTYHKVGFKDYFGFLRPKSVIFYDLGDISTL